MSLPWVALNYSCPQVTQGPRDSKPSAPKGMRRIQCVARPRFLATEQADQLHSLLAKGRSRASQEGEGLGLSGLRVPGVGV